MTEYNKKQPESLQKLFNTIAPQYDRANRVMSLNLHTKWNQLLVKSVFGDQEFSQYLDLCAGTGEIAFSAIKESKNIGDIFLLDFSESMLNLAKKKAKCLKFTRHRLHFLQADALDIPLPNKSIDAATLAYGVRNVQDPVRCFREVYRVLKNQAPFGILELTRPKNPLLKMGHKFYTMCVLPLVGNFFSSDKKAYQYLCKSIQEFIEPADLREMLIKAGFKNPSIVPLSGGIATIIRAEKKELT